MGLFDNLYDQNKPVINSPPLPQVPAAVTSAPAVDPMHALIASLFAPQTVNTSNAGGFDFGKLITALRNDPVGDYNRLGSLPSNAPGSQSPFNTGFFKDAAGRTAVEQARGPVGNYGPITYPHATLAPTVASPGPLAALFSQLSNESKRAYRHDPRYAGAF